MPIASSSFKEYGQILSESRSTPSVDYDDFLYWAKVAELGLSSRVSTGVLICNDRDRTVDKMERHVGTPEILVALKGDGIVCMVP